MPVAAIRPSRTPTPLGRRVRELRQAAGLTQAALAERTGGRVDRDYVKGLEAGRYDNIGLEKFAALAEVFGLSLDELRYGTSPTAARRLTGNSRRVVATGRRLPATARIYLVRMSVFPIWVLDELERIGVTVEFNRLKQPVAPQQAEGQEHECHGEIPEQGDTKLWSE